MIATLWGNYFKDAQLEWQNYLVGRHIVDFVHCRRHFGNDTKLVCYDGEEEGIENIAPDTLVRLG